MASVMSPNEAASAVVDKSAPGPALQFICITRSNISMSTEPPASIPADGFVWCDCDYENARAWVEPMQKLTGIRFFDDHLFDAENPAHPSYFDSTHSYEMIVFRGLDMLVPGASNGRKWSGDEDASAKSLASVVSLQAIKVRTAPTVFFVAPRCLITVRPAANLVTTNIRTRLLNAAEGKVRLPNCPEDLLLRLLNGLVDRYLDLRQPLNDQLEYWQQQLLNPRRPFRDWLLLLDARSQARRLEQLCEEQHDAVQEWLDERLTHGDAARDGDSADPADAPSAMPMLNDNLKVRAYDVIEHIHRVLSHAQRIEDSIESAVQLHFSATAHRTNEIMRTLTTITAIFMPLTLITGIFGMNFESIPGLHSPFGFWLTMTMMLAIVLVMLVVFRRKRYLDRDSAGRSRARG
jgi:magnesium transporter